MPNVDDTKRYFICVNNNECKETYQLRAKSMSSDALLPNFSKPFELNNDASHYGTGAVVYQHDERELSVIGCYSFLKVQRRKKKH